MPPLIHLSPCLLTALFFLVTGCASTPEHVVSLQARADSPQALEVVALLFSSYLVSDGSDPSATSEGGGTTQNVTLDSDTFFRSVGWQASINTSMVDVVGGMDRHWYHSQSVPESSIGLRKRFPGSEPGAVYVEVLARHGTDLDTNSGPQDYDGFAIGFGGTAPLDKHWFVDIGLVYERTLERVDIEGEDDHLSDIMLRFGIGFSL